MNKQEAEKCAKEMTYRDAVNNALRGKCIPYRKATLIKLYELLDIVEPQESESKMLVCPTCGLDVHSHFRTCPRCGVKIESEDNDDYYKGAQEEY